MGRLIFVAAAVLVVLGGAVGGAVYAFGNAPYQVTGHFLSAEGLVPQNDVVIDGTTVGTVTAVAVAPSSGRAGPDGALITMRLDPRYAPLREGTRAVIRPKSILGNMLIQLQPGSRANPPIPSGGAIPIQDTAAPVDLDQVLDLFNKTTRTKIKTLTLQGGQSLAGRGQDLNHVLATLPGITADTSQVTATLAQENERLNALDAEFASITAQIAGEDRNLRGMVGNGASVLNTLAANSQQQQAELTYLDSSLAMLNAGLDGHQKDLNRLLKEFPGLLQQLQQFSKSSVPALGILHPCVGDIITTLQYLQSATHYHDANGYLFRVYPAITPATPGNGSVPAPQPVACSGG